MATSGDYRNFVEIDAKRYSHIIDPRTGYPVDNGVVSVSVIADTCAFADGLATTVMVLGRQKGLEIVDRIAGVECLIVVRKEESRYSDYLSKGFKNYIFGPN
jgi:thiamine biosynthesis lipoprotein